MSVHETLESVKLRWEVRYPGGRTRQVPGLPSHVACGVCCEPAALDGATGRIVCAHCQAHVVTVIDREHSA